MSTRTAVLLAYLLGVLTTAALMVAWELFRFYVLQNRSNR